MVESSKRSHKGLKIWCGITALLFLIISVTILVLFLTILKLKDPKIITQSVTLEKLELVVFPATKLNISLGILVRVENVNYGSFAYEKSRAFVSYHGNVIGEAPIKNDIVPARGKLNISTVVDIFGDKLVSDKNFLGDFLIGVMNFTSSTTLHGKASLLKLLKRKATSYCSCEISFLLQANRVDSTCNSRFKL